MSSHLDLIYRSSLALLTDFYQLTMAYGYWRSPASPGTDSPPASSDAHSPMRLADQEAVFHLTFRKSPFQGGFAIAAGLEPVIEYLKRFRFEPDDLTYLATLKGSDEKRLFEKAFLDDLGKMGFSCDVDAIPEGTVVFPHEPLLRVKGPLVQCQLLETALLNLINFQTLVATKAARIAHAAGDEPVLEFGLRRAQGIDGGLSASRASYIGGCSATSNTLAGKIFGIPVRGTHAHSWVMAFDDELEAFRAFAEAMPNNAVFLVDTFDTIEGVKKACEIGNWLKSRGQRFLGVRLD